MSNTYKLCLHFVELILIKLSVYSSVNLSANLSLHFQLLYSRYSPTSHDVSNSLSQLLEFEINPSLHTPLSINSLHLQLYLSSFQRYFLFQTLSSNLHLHLHVWCHFLCLVSLVLDIRLKALTFASFATSGTHIFAYGSLMLL